MIPFKIKISAKNYNVILWHKRNCFFRSNERLNYYLEKNLTERQRMSTVYIVILTFIKPLEEIDAAIPAHVEWLKKGYVEGGPDVR